MRPEVTTKKGIFTGTREPNGILSFKGIPFAKPPVGRLRWQAPQELENSKERFDAGEFKPIPVQSEEDERYQGLPKSEDCLYLNIYMADLVKKNKPVLVWVYGGAYIKGGASRPMYSGDLMIEENPEIILVTVNYRLGVFATMNLSRLDPEGEYRYSNNLAQLDLRAALKWVHDNIANFGGNPDNVTIFGHSAGSSNISAQLMMAESRKYFNRAIMHSSFAVDIGTTSWENSLGAADVFFHILGNPSLEELLAMPQEQIYDAQVKLQNSGFFSSERKAFSVVLDGIVMPKNSFEQLAKGAAAGIDVIIGTCCGEYDQQFRPLSTEQKYEFLKSQCGKKVGDLDRVIACYREHNPIKPLDEIYMDIKNDLWLRTPANLVAEAMAPYSRVYLFHNMLRKENGVRAHHGNEYEMIFGRQDAELVSEELAHMVRQTWLQFAKGGEPRPVSLPEWPVYEKENRKTLVIDREPYIADGIRVKDLELLYPFFAESKLLNR